MTAPSVRPFRREEWRTYRDLRLQALADSPNAFGSTLAAEGSGTDDDWEQRLARGLDPLRSLPLLAEVDGTPIGLAWGRVDDSDPQTVHVYQMWVAPLYRRLGAGQRLLAAIVEWARANKVRQVVLDVTCGDTSAQRLYARAGFEPVGTPTPLRPGSSVLAQSMRLTLDENAGAAEAETPS